MKNILDVLETGYHLTGDPLDFTPSEEILAFLHKHMDGSDRYFSVLLTEIGCETTVRRIGKKVVRGRVGLLRK